MTQIIDDLVTHSYRQASTKTFAAWDYIIGLVQLYRLHHSRECHQDTWDYIESTFFVT